MIRTGQLSEEVEPHHFNCTGSGEVKRYWRKIMNERVTYLLNHEAVCDPAPALPGL